MTKQEIKQQILQDVEKYLEKNILKQFDKFEIIEPSNIAECLYLIKCEDKKNECVNLCTLKIEWKN